MVFRDKRIIHANRSFANPPTSCSVTLRQAVSRNFVTDRQMSTAFVPSGAPRVGIARKTGSLDVEKSADALVFSEDLNVERVFIGGEESETD